MFEYQSCTGSQLGKKGGCSNLIYTCLCTVSIITNYRDLEVICRGGLAIRALTGVPS